MLTDELQSYIDMRTREHEETHRTHLRYFLWCMPLGDDWKSKVNAAKKLLQELNGDQTVKYTDHDVAVLTDARLGKVISQHRDQLPAAFTAQKIARAERMHAEAEAMHITMLAESLSHIR